MTAIARRPARTLGAILAATALALGGVLIAPLSAQAATLTVTSSADNGAGSLRAVVGTSMTGDVIVFDPSVTSIALATSVTMAKGVTIDGGGTVTITRANKFGFVQLLAVPDSPNQDYVIAGLAVEGIAGSNGQGIYATIDSFGVRNITLSNVIVSGETAGYGAGFGLFGASGDVLIEGSTFQGNTSTSTGVADGGGAVDLDQHGGSVTVRNSVFASNKSANTGGGLRLRNGGFVGSLTVEDSTFDSNESAGAGGGLFVESIGSADSVLISSSTFSGNSIGDGATGVSVSAPNIMGRVDIVNSTFDEPGLGSFPIAGYVNGGVLDIRNSTIAGNGAVTIEAVTGPDGAAVITSSILSGGAKPAVVVGGVGSVLVSYSILSSALDAAITDDGGNQFSVADPKLGALGNNGGPTFTRLPLAGSPAINRGLLVDNLPFDQRGAGFPRVIAGRIDVGAVETSYALAATGQTVNILIPIIGGVLLLGGVAAIVYTQRRKRRPL